MKRILGIFLSLGLLLGAHAAQARNWKPQAHALAQDYLLIQDDRGQGEFVMVLWFDAAMIDPRTPGADQVANILRSYVLIGIAHIKTNALGRMENMQNTDPAVSDQSGAPKRELDVSDIPPAAMGVLAAMQATMQQNLGVFGQAIQWRLYNGQDIEACGTNGLVVSYSNEDYDYIAPIPGCATS